MVAISFVIACKELKFAQINQLFQIFYCGDGDGDAFLGLTQC